MKIEKARKDLRIGEKFIYKVYWMGMHIGEGTLHVKELVADMVTTFPGDLIVDRIKNKVTAGADVNPENVVTLIGEALFSFEKQLTEEDEEYFLKNDFARIAHEAKNPQHKKDGLHLAEMVKGMYKSLPPERRKAYMDKLNTMLDIFMDAAAIARKIGR